MTHIEMQIIVAAILASGGVTASGFDHGAEQMVTRFKAMLEELQKKQAVPPLR
jgi:hypothetical protein